MSNPTSKRLFVGGLPYRFTEGQLLELFAPFGRIVSLRIMHNQWGKSRGLGFVEFDDLQAAVNAKKKLHNYHVDADRTIIVDFAQPDPFQTPEGKQRHLESVRHKGRVNKSFGFHSDMRPIQHPDRDSEKFPSFNSSFGNKKPFKKRTFGDRPEIPKNRGNHLRQSVFNSRYYGARTGAKFAAKSRSKKNNH